MFVARELRATSVEKPGCLGSWLAALARSPATLSPMDFRTRQKKLRDHLATTRFDGLLVSHLPNIRYLCGFTGSAGLLLVEQGGSVFFTDVRYDIQAHEEVKGAKVVIARKAPLAALGDFLAKRRKRARGMTIGLESEHFTISERKRLSQLVPCRSAPERCAFHRRTLSHGQGRRAKLL